MLTRTAKTRGVNGNWYKVLVQHSWPMYLCTGVKAINTNNLDVASNDSEPDKALANTVTY